MSSNRLLNKKGKPPLDIIETDSQVLYTNKYIKTDTAGEKLTQEDSEKFRKYIEKKRIDERNEKLRSKVNEEEYIDDDNFYSPFAAVHINQLNIKKTGKDSYNIPPMKKPETIKTEKQNIVAIDTADRDDEKYPNQNNFITYLGKTFHNVTKIELISTEIPNTDQVIKETPTSIRNNLISWQNEEDRSLGFFSSINAQTNYPDTVDLYIDNHNLENKKYIRNASISIFNNPELNGKHFISIVDSNIIRIDLIGGIPAPTTCSVDTGIPNYTVSLTPGNYTAITLTSEISSQLNSIKRRNLEGIFHYFEVSVNLDTDIITFHSVIITQLIVNPIETSSGSNLVTIVQNDHGYFDGDIILITGVKNVGGYEATLLNGNFTVIVVDSNTIQYEVNERAVESAVGGGTTVKTGRKAPFRLLFNTGKSLIINNMGFPNEDSSESIGTVDPITTKTMSVSNAEIISINRIRLTTPVEHNFEEAIVLSITNITADESPIVTTSTEHHLELETRVEITNTDTIPPLSGTFSIQAVGKYSFKINNIALQIGGTTGIVKHGGDKIQINNIEAVPNINGGIYFVESITPFTFEIEENVNFISPESIEDIVIGSSQIFVNHPNHNFNEIISISPLGNTKALITTKVEHGLEGTHYENVPIETIVSNTVDITIVNNQQSTSNVIKIINSLSVPSIDGTYVVQIVDGDTMRINLVGGIGSASTATIMVGDTTILSNTNSSPVIDLDSLNQSIYFINKVSNTEFEIVTGFLLTSGGTYGLLNRDNRASLYRIESENENGSSIGGIPLRVLNKEYRNIDRILDKDNYMIRTTDHYATKTITAGGSNVKVTSERHGLRDFQSNTDNGEIIGNLYKSISLEGENYILLISKDLKTVFTPNNDSIGDVFAKILLSEPPGTMMFNSYISAPKIFDPPIPVLEKMRFQIKRGDGNYFNFTNIDFSFSLKITEIIEQSKENYYSSYTGSSNFGFMQQSREEQLS